MTKNIFKEVGLELETKGECGLIRERDLEFILSSILAKVNRLEWNC